MFDKSALENLAILGYSQLWLDSGILNTTILSKQITEFAIGEDTNTEHYRYKTFCHFVDNIDILENKVLQQIIEIQKSDNDKAMSSSATIHLLKKTYLTSDQFDTVSQFLRTFGDWTKKHIDKIKSIRPN